MNSPLRWHQSIAVKSFAIAFLVTHIPLLALVLLVALRPGWLGPGGVLGVALVATLLATALALMLLWRLFRPLRLAADGLRRFMTDGHVPRLGQGSTDEMGRLLHVLVLALAHLDRGRTPLLNAGALALERRTGGPDGDGSPHSLVLFEVDQWQALDESADVERMQQVQAIMHRHLSTALRYGELLLPWGRGRFLTVLNSSSADAFERVEALCVPFAGPVPGEMLTCSAVLEPRGRNPGTGPPTLQRLEYKLFALRLRGASAEVS